MRDLVLVGFNDDIHSAASNLAEALSYDPDFIFIQEGRVEVYRDARDPKTGKRLLDYRTYGVHQNRGSAAKAGSVVIWRHDAFQRTGSGFTAGGKFPGLMARFIAWVRGELVESRTRTFAFSGHYPPKRDSRFWGAFGLRLRARLRLAHLAGRVIIGQMDSNQHGGPKLPKYLRWVAVGDSIDGFVFSRHVKVLNGPKELPKDTSDHHPIWVEVEIV